jgi:PST family polysaccharide transporter
MHAKAMVRLFVVSEIFFFASYIGLAIFSCELIGLNGIVLGYAINYLMYFVVVYGFIYRKMR